MNVPRSLLRGIKRIAKPLRRVCCGESGKLLLMTMQLVTTMPTDEAEQVIEGVIWIDPERVSGAPCFLNTCVQIQNLFD